MISCAAANEMRWVKPSMATVSPSWTRSRMAACMVASLVMAEGRKTVDERRGQDSRCEDSLPGQAQAGSARIKASAILVYQIGAGGVRQDIGITTTEDEVLGYGGSHRGAGIRIEREQIAHALGGLSGN